MKTYSIFKKTPRMEYCVHKGIEGYSLARFIFREIYDNHRKCAKRGHKPIIGGDFIIANTGAELGEDGDELVYRIVCDQ